MLQTADNPRQSAGSFDAEGTMLERLTIAIVAVLLVAALVLGIR
jgi:hypothetical protein